MFESSGKTFEGKDRLSSLEFVHYQTRKPSFGAREFELTLKPQSGEFQVFLQKTLQFERGEIGSANFVENLVNWFPPLAQHPSASLTLQITLTAEQKSSLSKPLLPSQLQFQPQLKVEFRQPAEPQPAQSKPPQLQHVFLPLAKQQPLFSPSPSPPLSKHIKKTYGKVQQLNILEIANPSGSVPTKVSGKTTRLKNFWNKVDPITPYVFKKLYCFRRKQNDEIFIVENVNLY